MYRSSIGTDLHDSLCISVGWEGHVLHSQIDIELQIITHLINLNNSNAPSCISRAHLIRLFTHHFSIHFDLFHSSNHFRSHSSGHTVTRHDDHVLRLQSINYHNHDLYYKDKHDRVMFSNIIKTNIIAPLLEDLQRVSTVQHSCNHNHSQFRNPTLFKRDRNTWKFRVNMGIIVPGVERRTIGPGDSIRL